MLIIEKRNSRWTTCVLVVNTYTNKFGLHFGKQLPTKREFGNFLDNYAVTVKKDSGDSVPLRFEVEVILLTSSKILKYKHCTKNFATNSKSHETN